MKKNNGITLIALVITVIILLILAGVALSLITGQDGLFDKARQAGTSYNEASKNEANTVNQLISEMNKDGSSNNSPVVLLLSEGIGKEAFNEKRIYKESEESDLTITVPAGFKIVTGEETKINDGIVVEDNSGNQFVWIPVEDPSKMYDTKIVTTAYNDEMEIKVGKLYNNASSLRSYPGYNTGYREPAFLKDDTNGDSSANAIQYLKDVLKLSSSDNEQILKQFEKNLIDEFDEMIRSVEVNNGFYVGRYETSLNNDEKAESKSGVESMSASRFINVVTLDGSITEPTAWYGLYQKQKKFAENNNGIGSSMIWGCQYDQMMIWMAKNGVDVGSNISNKNTSDTTGSNSNDVVKNIYDLYGNKFEWTLEAFGTKDRARRSGSATNGNALAMRHSTGKTTDISTDLGSRIALYVK